MITKLEDLPDTNHNRLYGQEIVRKSLAHRRNQWKLELDWILGNDEWVPFAATVTFKNLTPLDATRGMQKATEYEYSKRVLNKVRRRLCRTSSKWNQALPIDYFFRYEHEQGSFFKPVPGANAPYHVHALLPVSRELVERIYDSEKGQLDRRLDKDLRSISTVSSFLIEPLRKGEEEAWARYMLKGKTDVDFA